jgi:hypothetical protein
MTDQEMILHRPAAVPSEDVWIYTPENLARIERGLEDFRAGRLVQMSPAELDAYGDQMEAERQHDEHRAG